MDEIYIFSLKNTHVKLHLIQILFAQDCDDGKN